MEKRITVKVDDYLDSFKLNIKSWIEENDNIEFSIKSDLLKFVYDYEALTLTKEDFMKRKRNKSVVPLYLRCMAKRSCGEQCTRKRKEGLDFCGTHEKNRPHGVASSNDMTKNTLTKVEVWIQEINGISYYIDNKNNIYKTEDILSNINNPSIIAKYIVDEGVYKFMDTYS
jgi:hypothetical protein